MKSFIRKAKALLIFMREVFARSYFYVQRRKAIGYIGGHGANNLGDDVMFHALKSELFQDKLITFQTVGIEKLLAKVGLSGNKFFKLLILGGGTLINDMWHNKVSRSSQLGIPTISLGTGVGSCGIEQFEKVDVSSWQDILRNFLTVNVRGELSKAKLNNIGVSSKVSGDLALLLANENINYTYDKKVGLNLMDIAKYNDNWESLLPSLSDLCKEGWTFEALILNPSDLVYTKKYFQKLGATSDKFKVISDYNEFLSASEKLAFTICVRLHGSVLSLCNNIPTILFGYRDKCKDFMSSMGLEDYYIDLDKDNKPLQISEAILSLKSDAIQKSIREKSFKMANNYKSRTRDIIRRSLIDTSLQ